MCKSVFVSQSGVQENPPSDPTNNIYIKVKLTVRRLNHLSQRRTKQTTDQRSFVRLMTALRRSMGDGIHRTAGVKDVRSLVFMFVVWLGEIAFGTFVVVVMTS